MELFEQIRREYTHGVGTIKGVAQKFGVHRRVVREAVANAVPKPRKETKREKVKMAPVIPWIEGILEADQKAPRKQRHTAHRIWRRLKAERPEVDIAESTVRLYVRKRKIELGLVHGEVFIPQTYQWGQEGQVDWYEARAEIDGEQQKVYVFCMRSMGSGGAFHRAYPHASQQAFLEAHELAFEYFGGVFKTLRFDNLGSAVKKILRGHEREQNERFIAFRSHWGFESEFCMPAQGHEKGGVEGENGYYRRNHMVPVPKVGNWEELNAMLLAESKQDEQRMIGDRSLTVGAGMCQEREYLLPLAKEGFDLAAVYFPSVDGKGCVRVLTNFYSATPLEQWRAQGRWPASFDLFWEASKQRRGKQDGTRVMIDLLMVGRERGYDALRQAIEKTLEIGSSDVSVVLLLLNADRAGRRRSNEPVEIGELTRYDRPMPTTNNYDQLLKKWPDVGVIQ